ncbi:agarase, partial [Pseudomonas sp. GW460-C3]
MRRTGWGGVVDDGLEGSGFFRIAERNGVFWFVDPDGGRFISKGINTVRFDQDHIGRSERVPYAEACRAKYGSLPTWRAAASNRLA